MTSIAPEAPAVAGPISAEEAASLPQPPMVPISPLVQLLRFSQRQTEFMFRARRKLGDVFLMSGTEPPHFAITGLPDDVRSLFTAKPEEAPSYAAESPL